MTKEEKIEEAKRLYKTANADQRYVLESLFPELKESEDERIRKAIINTIEDCSPILSPEVQKRMIAWLEKQAPKPKWSEEDESIVKDVIYFLDTAKVHYASTKALDDCIDWLKSLKNKVLPKQEWSDEDEELLQHCYGAVAAADYYTLEDKEEMGNWLKTIKQRMEDEQ